MNDIFWISVVMTLSTLFYVEVFQTNKDTKQDLLNNIVLGNLTISNSGIYGMPTLVFSIFFFCENGLRKLVLVCYLSLKFRLSVFEVLKVPK